jgi:hypothetical protein
LRDLFFVSDPFHILSAVEAKAHFKTEESVLIVLLKNKPELDKIIKRAILLFEWGKIIYVNPPKKYRFLFHLKFVKSFLKQYSSGFRYIFLKDIASSPVAHFQKVLAVNLKHQKIFSLDDGAATIIDYQTKERETSFFKKYRWMLFGLKYDLKQKYSFFTVFKLKQKTHEIVSHNFFHFRKKIEESEFSKNPNNFYFIGSPLVNENIISEQTFKETLRNIIKNSKENSKYFYIPHRRCDDKSIEIVKEIGFEISKFNMPIELVFLEKKEMPVNIISYYSTALLSLKVIFDVENAFMYEIDSEQLLKMKKEISNVFLEYKKYGINRFSSDT